MLMLTELTSNAKTQHATAHQVFATLLSRQSALQKQLQKRYAMTTLTTIATAKKIVLTLIAFQTRDAV